MRAVILLTILALAGCGEDSSEPREQRVARELAEATAARDDALSRCRSRPNPDLRALCVRSAFETYERMAEQARRP